MPGSGGFDLYLFSFGDFDTKIEEGGQLEAVLKPKNPPSRTLRLLGFLEKQGERVEFITAFASL